MKFRLHILIVVLATILVTIWFRNGLVLGAAESSLPFSNLEAYQRITKWAWAEPALGNNTGIYTASWPTYLVLSLLEKNNIPGFLIEALLFWTILIVSGFSVFYLTRDFFPKLNDKYLFLAAIFYWFNPFMMINVWNRFLYSHMIFAAFLPLSALLFRKGVKSTNYVYILLLGLCFGIFSYALTSIPFNIIFWMVFLALTIFELTNRWNLKVLLFFGLTFLIYILVDFWWITQLFSFINSSQYTTTISSFFSADGNLTTLSALSDRLGKIVNTIRLMHEAFFKNAPDYWMSFYNTRLAVVLEFFFPLILFLGVIRERKNKNAIFLSVLFVFCLLLVKGNSPPLGELFELIFSKFSFTQVFRNPFEKFGFLLPLFFCPLLAFYLSRIFDNKIAKNIIYFLSLFIVLVFWGFPYWTGLIFVSSEKNEQNNFSNYEVEVPNYYRQANAWIEKQSQNARFLVFPLGGEGITYSWKHGYSGIELSDTLFNVSAVSLNTTIPFYYDVSKNLEEQFLEKSNFNGLANLLNAKYVMSRSDIDYKSRQMRDPRTIELALSDKEKNGEFKKEAEFEKISFWRNLNWKDNTVYASNNFLAASSQSNLSDITLNEGEGDILVSNSNPVIPANAKVYHPESQYKLVNNVTEGFESRQDLFPYSSYLPGSKFYKLSLYKEYIDQNTRLERKKRILSKVSYLGKRISEIYNLISINEVDKVSVPLQIYKDQLKDLSEEFRQFNNENFKEIASDWEQESVLPIFLRYKNAIANIKNNNKLNIAVLNLIDETEKEMDVFLVKSNLSPKFGFIQEDNFKIDRRSVQQFKVDDNGSYEILIDGLNSKNFSLLDGKKMPFQLDDKVYDVIPKLRDDGRVSFGSYDLTSGYHEIGFNEVRSENKIDFKNEEYLKVDHGVLEKKYIINDFDPYSDYEINFDYFIKSGGEMQVSFASNNDSALLNGNGAELSQTLKSDIYYFDFRNFDIRTTPNKSADSGYIRLRVLPWNNCLVVFGNNKGNCDKDQIRRTYDKTTEIVVRNMVVTKIPHILPLLVHKINLNQAESTQPQITYKKINPTKYIVDINSAKNDYMLVLSELFNQGWVATVSDGTKINDHYLVNTYANGWWINKRGNYQITLDYVPQKFLDIGKLISTSVFAFCVFGILFYWFRRNAHD